MVLARAQPFASNFPLPRSHPRVKKMKMESPATMSSAPEGQAAIQISAFTAAEAGDCAESTKCPSPDTTSMLPWTANRRILIVDDNPAIHGDFRKILAGKQGQQAALQQAEEALFGSAPAAATPAT